MGYLRLSRRRVLAGAGCAAIATGLSGCRSAAAPLQAPSRSAAPDHSAAPPSTTAAPPATPAASSSTTSLDEAALRRKIASLLVVGFRGEQVGSGDWIMRAITEQGLGGVILFDRDQLTGARRNIASPGQVSSLIRSLRQASPSLIVSLDQEGGHVARLNPGDGFPATLSQAQIGAANSPTTTRTWAQTIAGSLAQIGATLNFAPVVDVNVNPTNPAIGALGRSFSANADVVVANASQEISVHRSLGIRTVIKHFPGFGSATGNTDFGVVDVSSTWRRSELAPFQRLISSGSVDAVMVAHLLNRQLDASRPASLSAAVITNLLRGQLGWHGAVASDDMQAAAITTRYGAGNAVGLAVQAGVDLLVFANQQVYNPAVVEQTVATVTSMVLAGTISPARIDESVARVNALRPRR